MATSAVAARGPPRRRVVRRRSRGTALAHGAAFAPGVYLGGAPGHGARPHHDALRKGASADGGVDGGLLQPGAGLHLREAQQARGQSGGALGAFRGNGGEVHGWRSGGLRRAVMSRCGPRGPTAARRPLSVRHCCRTCARVQLEPVHLASAYPGRRIRRFGAFFLLRGLGLQPTHSTLNSVNRNTVSPGHLSGGALVLLRL